ncbi:polyhydroxyalkanoic acid system family protein [Moraxella equi]|uniref:Polyhydroxyalkanoic acid system protein n=1 Tax=Moraxella equi TaxID=60442 RepID=A0A378QRB2_9GAMM|nr:polyhydroxyalkanoic acid system family protein [Moraxella equi]OPH39715.1 polyhydroxyalkanoic acid system protein [Moraxella equi]STZ02814.1 putative polyhydroxyalkanoic acid system protein [Moraxella equi]
MSDLRIEKRHNFDLATARTKAKAWLEEAKQEFDFEATYQEGADSDTVNITKAGVDGRAFLDSDKVIFEADLNFLAKPFKGMISSGIQEGLDKYFA